jgi:hypothetical protein
MSHDPGPWRGGLPASHTWTAALTPYPVRVLLCACVARALEICVRSTCAHRLRSSSSSCGHLERTATAAAPASACCNAFHALLFKSPADVDAGVPHAVVGQVAGCYDSPFIDARQPANVRSHTTCLPGVLGWVGLGCYSVSRHTAPGLAVGLTGLPLDCSKLPDYGLLQLAPLITPRTPAVHAGHAPPAARQEAFAGTLMQVAASCWKPGRWSGGAPGLGVGRVGGHLFGFGTMCGRQHARPAR